MPTEHLRQRSVLVVDDNVDAADSFALILEFEGYRVTTANDGRSALESVERHPPFAILLDLGLPDIDGFEVARRVRDRFGPREPLIVALSGHGGLEDLQATRAIGFDAHLVKPVDPQVILELLARRRDPALDSAGASDRAEPGTPFA